MTASRSIWRNTTLGDVARWGSGGTPSTSDGSLYGGTIPWVVIGDLTDGPVYDTAATLTDAGLTKSAAKLVPPDAILVAMYGASIGRLGLTTREVTTNQAIAHAIPHPGLNLKYLFFYLMSQKRSLVHAGKGAAQPNIGQGVLKAWPIVFPESLDEQRRIVDLLEEHLSRLDAAEQGLANALARSETLLTAGLWHATHGLDELAPVELQSIAEVRLGRQRSPKNHTGDRMRPYLRAANVDWDSLRLEDVKEMQFSETEQKTYQLETGDILLTEASGSPAEVGKSVIYRGMPADVCFQNTLLRVRCHSADPEFVQKYLLAEARAGRFMPEARGVGINHLGRARLATLPIQTPSPEHQSTAVAACRELVEGIERSKATIIDQAKRSAGLRRSLLAAAFSGRLTSNASDVSAAKEMIGA